MSPDELAAHLAERGYRFEYNHAGRGVGPTFSFDELHASTAWCRWWVWRIDGGELAVWGKAHWLATTARIAGARSSPR